VVTGHVYWNGDSTWNCYMFGIFGWWLQVQIIVSRRQGEFGRQRIRRPAFRWRFLDVFYSYPRWILCSACFRTHLYQLSQRMAQKSINWKYYFVLKGPFGFERVILKDMTSLLTHEEKNRWTRQTQKFQTITFVVQKGLHDKRPSCKYCTLKRKSKVRYTRIPFHINFYVLVLVYTDLLNNDFYHRCFCLLEPSALFLLVPMQILAKEKIRLQVFEC